MEDVDEVPVHKYAATFESIEEAQRRIRPYVHITPVLTCSSISIDHQRFKLYFKCELFQKGGSFKIRGASNAVFSLSEDAASKGVLTHSSGNHAAAVALAAKIRGIPAYIVMPKNAPTCKIENVKRYGGQIVFCEPTLQSREQMANQLFAQTGASMIHPYNDGHVISGQGTIALELLEQVPHLDAIIVPVSGGGLVSGIAIAAKLLKPSIHVYAAEPKGADDAAQSKAAGRIITLGQTNTIADGLRASLGSLTWPIFRDLVNEVITVEEKEIVDATLMCYERLKVVVEPSGAVSLAAALSSEFQLKASEANIKHLGVILSGGNVDLGSVCGFFKF